MKANIIKLLLYSEIFQHPLSLFDIESKFENPKEVEASLSELVDLGLVSYSDGNYYVFEKSDKIERRIRGNKEANRLMPKAQKQSRFISRFPFVEGVAISGSLSKGVLHDDGDFDFFIVTTPNRLWIARSVLILYKKLFLLNSKKYFCVNYFVDSNNLEIEEKNIFTAMEISSLLEMEGSVFSKFRTANQWVNEFVYYSNQSQKSQFPTEKSISAKCIQILCRGKVGEWIDTLFLKLTLKRWNKKFDHFQPEKFDLTMKSRKYISKHHPNDFQRKVLTMYDSILLNYKKLNSDKLSLLQLSL